MVKRQKTPNRTVFHRTLVIGISRTVFLSIRACCGIYLWSRYIPFYEGRNRRALALAMCAGPLPKVIVTLPQAARCEYPRRAFSLGAHAY